MIGKIDGLITKLYYRRSLHKDEVDSIMREIGHEWTPWRDYLTSGEVTDLLLEARLSHMKEGMNGELQEEFDALVGADINTS